MARFRLTGLSAPLGGAQWEKKDDDREVARRVLNLLGDRRMLWADFSMEVYEHCGRSADFARKELGRHLDSPEIGPDMRHRIKRLQALFRDFMDEAGPCDYMVPTHRGYGTDPLSMALGRLRGLVGVEIGHLAATYNLDVPDDLANIVPDQQGWFFAQFNR